MGVEGEVRFGWEVDRRPIRPRRDPFWSFEVDFGKINEQ